MDGASVHVGDHTGLKAQMQQALPWSWCYAHWVELACKNAFCSSLFNNIVEMLLRLFYIYEKSAKNLHELTSIVDDLQCVFDFQKEDTYLFDHMEQDGSFTREKHYSVCWTGMVPIYTTSPLS